MTNSTKCYFRSVLLFYFHSLGNQLINKIYTCDNNNSVVVVFVFHFILNAAATVLLIFFFFSLSLFIYNYTYRQNKQKTTLNAHWAGGEGWKREKTKNGNNEKINKKISFFFFSITIISCQSTSRLSVYRHSLSLAISPITSHHCYPRESNMNRICFWVITGVVLARE